jgi:PAS domain-containing protein
VLQVGAETTRDAVLQILDNLPDAVLMLEAERLTYCNRRADEFFGVGISELVNGQEELFKV